MSADCPLCKSGELKVLESFETETLRKLYRERLQVDIDACLESVPPAQFELYQCPACGLEFFPATLAGNSKLYSQLGEHPDYYGKEKWEFELAALELQPGNHLLEIGSGYGHFLQKAKGRIGASGSAIGLEFNPTALKRTQSEGLQTFDLTIEKFRIKNPDHKGFDTVCSFQVLEHVTSPGELIEQMLTVLKPGGRLILSVPNRESFFGSLPNDILNFPPHHLTRWSTGVFEWVAKRHGLKLDRVAEEPIASYHREWFERATAHRLITRLTGKRPAQLGDSGFWPHQRERLVTLMLKTLPIGRLQPWAPGHTLYVSFKKAN